MNADSHTIEMLERQFRDALIAQDAQPPSTCSPSQH